MLQRCSWKSKPKNIFVFMYRVSYISMDDSEWLFHNRKILILLNFSRMSQKLLWTYPQKNRKPWNYNGTINFEIDIMKKSSPLNKNLCQTRLCLIVFWLFSLFFVYVHCNTTDCINWLHQKRSAILVLTVAKPWILNWLGKTFSWYQFPVFVL